MNEAGYSLSDIATATNGGMFGGNNEFIWIFALLILFGGGGFGYNRQGEFGQYATAASQSEVLSGQKFDALSRQINQVGNGLCSSTYALNNSILSEGRAIQTQLAQCCCDNQRNVDSVRFDMANYACQINQNIDNKFAALEKAQLEQTIQAQANQINQLNLAQQMCGVVRYPNAWTYNAGASPFCGGNGCCN